MRTNTNKKAEVVFAIRVPGGGIDIEVIRDEGVAYSVRFEMDVPGGGYEFHPESFFDVNRAILVAIEAAKSNLDNGLYEDSI